MRNDLTPTETVCGLVYVGYMCLGCFQIRMLNLCHILRVIICPVFVRLFKPNDWSVFIVGSEGDGGQASSQCGHCGVTSSHSLKNPPGSAAR